MLRREDYIKQIIDALVSLQRSFEFRISVSLLDANIIAEDFVKNLLNIILDLKLENLNSTTVNQVGIDLGDSDNGVAVQVTSTKTTRKIQATIDKLIEYNLYKKYPQLYVFVLQDKQKSYEPFNTEGFFTFDVKKHILDFKSLIIKIKSLEIEKLRTIKDLIDEEIDNNRKAPRLRRKPPTSLEQLKQRTEAWLKTLNYSFEESHEIHTERYFERIINIPARRGFDRVLVRGIASIAEMSDINNLRESVEQYRVDEGWLISARRVSQSVRKTSEETQNCNLLCYTFDELLDEDADFGGYIVWLENEIQRRGIDKFYVPLACKKDEFDPIKKEKITTSYYDEENGWIDGYIDQWLDDPAKEHISILGEFGMGKTWFALHYAWTMLQRYKKAKIRGVERPRLPLYIPLRDYAKAVSIESLFSEFFFRKHEIPIPGYSAFEELNRMGKLLLIFDGFDEMAAQIDRQKMINNFWQLARAVVPGTKVILTCRTEHFPEAKEGRNLLNAELKASVSALTGEPPQFEVLELQKLNDKQIHQLLSNQANPATVQLIINDSKLLDLARRPVMTELILEALPDIERGKPLDLSRIYLYAVQRKMERDIKSERTFTSLTDKLYFLCELSWEMLSTDQMRVNYRDFPDRLRRLFPHAVREQKDLDHWHYDMMGQTMLVRNADGDYSPAHRSLLEFFVAYKFAAELGALESDFMFPARTQSDLDEYKPQQNYTWTSYFQREVDKSGAVTPIPPLKDFTKESIKYLATTFGKSYIPETVLTFLEKMVVPKRLWTIVQDTKDRTIQDVGYTGGNAVTILRRMNEAFREVQLERTVLIGANLFTTDLSGANLRGAVLIDANLSGCTLENTDLCEADLTDIQIKEMGQVFALSWCPTGDYLASGSGDANIGIWNTSTWEQIIVLKTGNTGISKLIWSPSGDILIALNHDGIVNLWDSRDWTRIDFSTNPDQKITALCFSKNARYLGMASSNGIINLYDGKKLTLIDSFSLSSRHPKAIVSLDFSPDEDNFVVGYDTGLITVYNIPNKKLRQELYGSETSVTQLCFDHKTGLLVSFKGDFKVSVDHYGKLEDPNELSSYQMSVLYEELATNLFNQVWAEKSEEFYLENREKFEEQYAQELSQNPSNEQLSSLKSDFLALENPVLYDDIAYWVDDMIVDQAIHLEQDEVLLARNTHLVGFAEKWDLETGQRKLLSWSVEHHGRSLAALQDNSYSIGCDDGIIKIWDNQFIKIIAILRGHEGAILTQSLHPHGKLLATGSRDATIRIWDIDSQSPNYEKCLNTLRVKMNCRNLRLTNAKGLDAAAPDGKGTLGEWLVQRGAVL